MQLKSKLSIFLLIVIVVASMFAYMGAIIVSNKSFISNIKQSQSNIAETIITAYDETDLPIQRIVAITYNALYPVQTVDNIEDMKLSEVDKEALDKGEILFLKQRVFPVGITLAKADDFYIIVDYSPEDNLFRNYAMLLAYALLFSIIAFMLIIIGISNRAMKPIHQLNKATKEVAKGNFDVVIESDSQDEIGQLTESFNKMTKELKSIEYLRKDFVSNVSHEFKTPISSVLGFARLLQSGRLTEEEKKDYLAIIVEESERLSNLSSNLLKLSKLENQDVFVRNEYRLDEQIRRVILLLEPKWAQKKLTLEVDMEDISYLADEDLMQQVWVNLLSNAVKFSKDGGNISVLLYSDKENAVAIIKDNGIGMDEQTKNRLYEKFFKGDASHSKEGAGLGMTLVKRIVDLHQGHIQVESEQARGTSIKIILPNEFRGWESIEKGR